VGGSAAVRGRLQGAAGLPRARRMTPERRRHPDPAAANGSHPRRRHR
jgi:hypothetical protein